MVQGALPSPWLGDNLKVSYTQGRAIGAGVVLQDSKQNKGAYIGFYRDNGKSKWKRL